jgi:hypothetical protein
MVPHIWNSTEFGVDLIDWTLIEQLGALGQEYKEAYTYNDAAALAALYTWDAVIVTPQGPV